ncbi:MAG: ATP synthase F1 subunit epsilon [Thermoanaerobaculia bacterium]
MDGRLALTVVTPERALLQGVACDEVAVPARRGELGILPGHTPLIALLGIGLVTYRDGAKKVSVAVRGGFAEIAGDVVRVLADEAVVKADVDTAKAASEKTAAEERRSDVVGDEELDAANAEARFAEARLSVAAS